MKTNNYKSLLIAACERSVAVAENNANLLIDLIYYENEEAASCVASLNPAINNSLSSIAAARIDLSEILAGYGFYISSYSELSNNEFYHLIMAIQNISMDINSKEINLEDYVDVVISNLNAPIRIRRARRY